MLEFSHARCFVHLTAITVHSMLLVVSALSKTFDVEPSSLEVYLGDVAVFECRIGGQPRPSVRWLRDDHVLDTDSQGYKLHLDGTLEISIVHFQDFARYKCEVENVDRSRSSREAVLQQNANISEWFFELFLSRRLSTASQSNTHEYVE